MLTFNFDTRALLSALEQYKPISVSENDSRLRIKDFVSNNRHYCDRNNFEAHITASAWITSREKTQALLLHHKKLDIWIQPGGHIEASDLTLEGACLRELKEETGLTDAVLVSPGIFDVDIHQIPARKKESTHFHFDIRLWFESETMAIQKNDEAHDLAWFDLDHIKQVTQDPSVLRMVEKTSS